jgi:hypothetical protein
MAGLIDKYMVWQFVKRLATPFEMMPAYKLGLIDKKGRFLVSINDLVTIQQQQALTEFDILIINLKRLLAQLPGGSSNIANLAAGLLLLKQWGLRKESLQSKLFSLEEDFNAMLNVVEDAPVMSSGSGAVYGTRAGETVVTKKGAEKYKKKNKSQINKLFQESISLSYHSELNPKLWNPDGSLKEEVRAKLMQIAFAWADFAKIPVDSVRDIIITGGNVNYNYTGLSDIDLHLIVDRGQMNPDRDFVDEYLSDKKILWTLSHNDLNIYGYPVELYAQDINEMPHQDQGVYSINTNSWIQRPRNLGLDFENDYHLQQKADFYKDLIDKMIEQHATDETIDMLKKKIYKMRGDSIAQGGEFGFGNLVFKELRNAGYLDKMAAYIKSNMDKNLSLE